MGGQQSHLPVSSWVSATELPNLKDKLSPGDALEFNRGGYKHWGVYLGYRRVGGRHGDWVIHLSSPPNATFSNVVFQSQSFNKREHALGGVSIDDVEDVLKDSKLRINNSMDSQIRPYNRESIIQRALDALEYYPEYNVLKNNCEHFVNWIRYGTQKSSQAQGAEIGIYAGAVGTGVAAFTALLASRS